MRPLQDIGLDIMLHVVLVSKTLPGISDCVTQSL